MRVFETVKKGTDREEMNPTAHLHLSGEVDFAVGKRRRGSIKSNKRSLETRRLSRDFFTFGELSLS